MKQTFPRIGMRMMKSAFAVFICLGLNILRNGEGIVFYSCIAAVLCMQSDLTTSFQTAFNRIIGTFHGGLMGLIVLLIIQTTFVKDFLWIRYLLISFGIIVVIYLTLIYQKEKASYISCVVFLSITVSHGLDVNPYLFAYNRMLDTGIGIVVALFLNRIHFPFYQIHKRLYIVSWDCLINDQKHLDAYAKIKLKQFMERNGKVLLFSETPMITNISQISMSGTHPGFLMDTLYYDKDQIISSIQTSGIKEIIGIQDCFSFHFVDDMVYVYYEKELSNKASKWMKKLRKNEYFSCIKEECQKDAFLLIQFGEKEELEQKKEQLIQLNSNYLIYVLAFEDTWVLVIADQAFCLKDRLNRLLQQTHYDEVIVFAKKDYFNATRFYPTHNYNAYQIIHELYRDAKKRKLYYNKTI